MSAQIPLPPLTEAERKKVNEAFLKYDEDQSGSIDIVRPARAFSPYPVLTFILTIISDRTQWELRKVMHSMGKTPSEEELLEMITEVDEDGSGSIELAEVSTRVGSWL